MKQLLLLFCLLTGVSYAQVCTIDYTQTQTGIYPDTLPTGYVGQAYNTDITFVMPLDTMGYDFTNFHIFSVALPVGLSWECNNNTNDCNYNPQVSQHGCVNISGTPLLAGVYNVDVTVIADLTVISGYPFTFQIYLEILPSNVTTTNDGFTMTGPTGCSPITVDFTNNNPGLLAYEWDFGNGNTSTLEDPAPQVYSAPGDYIVHYAAYDNLNVIDVYTLTGVTVNSMSNYGAGFPSYDNADTYIKIKENGTVIYQSSIIADQNPPVSFSMSLLLNPANTYVLQVYEADDGVGEVLLGADDFMGNHTMMLSGCTGCAVTGGDSGSGASVNYSITHQVINPTPAVVSVDTVHVYGYPPVPTVSFDAPSHTLSTPDLGYSYQWYINGSPQSGATNPDLTIWQSGVYYVVAINPEGCVSFSDTITGVYCDPFIEPVIALGGNSTLVATDVPVGYDIAWYLNGTLIPGAINDTLTTSDPGVYTVEMTDSFGCVHTSNNFNVNLGIYEVTDVAWTIYPNPASDLLHIQLDSNLPVESIQITDLSGRVILSEPWSGELLQTIPISELSAGYYTVKIRSGSREWGKVLIKQ